MKHLTSDQLETNISFGHETDRLHIYDGLTTPVSEDVLALTPDHQRQIEQFTLAALQAYGPRNGTPEATLAHQRHGIPTLVGRVDCTIGHNGDILPYELEDSPSGMGIANLLHHRTAHVSPRDVIVAHFQRQAGDIPHIIVSGSRSHGTDDALVVGKDRYHFEAESHDVPAHITGDSPVIVKTVPGHLASAAPYAHLSERAVAPLLTEGDKTYATRTGLLHEIGTSHDLLTDESGQLRSQVVKACVGSMAMGISVYLAPQDRKDFGKKGIVTGSRLAKDLEGFVMRDGAALVQEFAGPVRISNPEARGNMILRVFVLCGSDDRGQTTTQAIGGCYVARPELVVHGSANSVTGAILVE